MGFFDFFKKKNAAQYAIEGDQYCLKLQYEKALKCFERAVELEPNNDEYYAYRSFAKKQLGDLNGALIDLDKAIELNPDFEIYQNVKKTLTSS